MSQEFQTKGKKPITGHRTEDKVECEEIIDCDAQDRDNESNVENENDQTQDNTCGTSGDTMAQYGVSLVGFIGAGSLARILMKGFLSTELLGANDIVASDINPDVLKLSEAMEVNTTLSNCQVVNSCNVVILAVEPDDMPLVLREIKDDVTNEHLLISVAAGVTLDAITECLVPELESLEAKDNTQIDLPRPRVIRVMTNTPTSVKAGVTVYSLGNHVTERDDKLVKILFSSVGLCECMAETSMDAVTGVSGSGPAYVFTAIEALSDGGVKMGLPRDLATKFAAQTLLGAAKMVLETGQHPGQLKDGVTSPGGTTIAGLHELEISGFRASLINAVQAATLRSKELGSKK